MNVSGHSIHDSSMSFSQIRCHVSCPYLWNCYVYQCLYQRFSLITSPSSFLVIYLFSIRRKSDRLDSFLGFNHLCSARVITMKCYSAFFLHKPKYVLSSKLPLLSPHFYISSWFSQANPARSHHISSLEAEAITVDVKAAKGFLESGYVYLDVRTVEEFKKGHVQTEKILNIPYMFNTPEGRVKNPKFLNEVSAVCKEEDHLVVGCQSGVRSLSATADLLNAGFKDASNMGGGYIAWVQNGFPLKVEEEEKAQL